MTASPRQLHSFHGGLRLQDHKGLSTSAPLRACPLPPALILPLQQHIGNPAHVAVDVGEQVSKGQVLAFAEGYVSVPLHAPTSGRIAAIEARPVAHPSGLHGQCIVLEPDGEDRWIQRPLDPIDYAGLNPSDLRNRIREAGIVGLGGAGFPTFIKLNPSVHPSLQLLLLNGAECEPYISCDDTLMRERADDIVEGARIMRHALQAEHTVIALEDNKPRALEALGAALERLGETEMELVTVPSLYPAGGEKQLIQVVTGQEVPSNGLPLDLGIVCHNVATAAAVHEAIAARKPLTHRIVTVTGNGVRQPANLEVALGTPFGFVIEQCGGYAESARRLIMGGPMMGFTVTDDQVPVIKTTNCILVADADEAPDPLPALPCIRCGACTEVCPARLLPQQLYWHARAKEFDKVQDYHLFDCIECGCCAHVCPSHIPLVQYYRYAKTEIWAQEREREKADASRRRHEFHKERLEREKREREQRMRKKKALVQPAADRGSDQGKQEAIEAALARVKEKQKQRDAKPRADSASSDAAATARAPDHDDA